MKNLYSEFQKKRENTEQIMNDVAVLVKKIEGQEARSASISEEALRLKNDDFSVMIVGEFKRGKSTFINALLGNPILPAKAAPCTAVITEISYGEEPSAILHPKEKDKPSFKIDIKQIKDYVTISADDSENGRTESKYRLMELKYPLGLCKNGVKIIDSPGLNEHGSRTEVSLGYLGNADAVIMILSCQQMLSESERSFIQTDLKSNRELSDNFFVFNHYDGIRDNPDDERDIVAGSKKKFKELGVNDSCLYFISALDALRGRSSKNQSLVELSNLENLEKRLEIFLSQDRGRVKLSKPIKVTSSAIEHCELTVPKIIETLRCSIAELEGMREKVKPILSELELGKEEFIRDITIETEDVRERLCTSYASFVYGATDAIRAHISPMNIDELNRCRDQINDVVKSKFDVWREADLKPMVSAYDKKMSSRSKQHSSQFMRKVENANSIIQSRPEVPATADSALSEMLASVGLQDLDIRVSAENGDESFISKIFGSVGSMGTSGVILTALTTVLKGPALLAATAVVSLLAALLGKAKGGHKVEAIRDEIVQKARESLENTKDEFRRNLTVKLDSGVGPFREALEQSMNTTISELRNTLDDIIAKKNNAEFDANKRADELQVILKDLKANASKLESIRISMTAPI